MSRPYPMWNVFATGGQSSQIPQIVSAVKIAVRLAVPELIGSLGLPT